MNPLLIFFIIAGTIINGLLIIIVVLFVASRMEKKEKPAFTEPSEFKSMAKTYCDPYNYALLTNPAFREVMLPPPQRVRIQYRLAERPKERQNYTLLPPALGSRHELPPAPDERKLFLPPAGSLGRYGDSF